MSLDFSIERWDKVTRDYNLWWQGKLGRPLFNISVTGLRKTDRPAPTFPVKRRMAQYDSGVSAEQIIDAIDYGLSQQCYAADSFPHVFTDFGAGVVAAFLGCRAQVDDTTVWFHAPDERQLSEMHFEFRDDHPWIKRIMDIYAAAEARWGKLVQMSIPDLGGAFDILSSFRPGEKLLLDLYDCPEQVKRTAWEIHECWWRYFDYFAERTSKFAPGYSAWAGIFSSASHYMLQSDFAYMVSPQMFDDFIAPELAACCDKLGNAFYHLDGPGQLAHLDTLVAIDSLKGIQWIPGSGNKPMECWPEVYQKIRQAGKLAQLYVGGNNACDVIETIAQQTGNIDNAIFIGSVDASYAEQLNATLVKYGADPVKI